MKTVWKVYDCLWAEELTEVFATKEAAERYLRSIYSDEGVYESLEAQEAFDFEEVTVIE